MTREEATMTLDEAIKHAEEVAEEKESEAEDLEYSRLDWRHEANQCLECAKEHRQLAEWLKDYKRLLEQEPVLDKIRDEIERNMESVIGKYDSSIPKFNMPSYKIERNKVRKECISIIDKYKADMRGGEERKEPSEWQQDHAILKAHADGANEVLDRIKAARKEMQKLRGCSCSCSDGIIDDVEDIIDKLIAEVEGTNETD